MLVPATDVHAWSMVLERLATDPALRTDVAARGRTRAAGFSWETSARAAMGALEAAVASRRHR